MVSDDEEDDSAEKPTSDRKPEEEDDGGGGGGEHFRHRGHLPAPSKPEIVKVSNSSVVVHWMVQSPSGGHVITGFKLQFKEMADDGTGLWRTVGDAISSVQRTHNLSRLKPGETTAADAMHWAVLF